MSAPAQRNPNTLGASSSQIPPHYYDESRTENLSPFGVFHPPEPACLTIPSRPCAILLQSLGKAPRLAWWSPGWWRLSVKNATPS